MRWLLALLCLTFTAFSHANATPSLGGSPIDKVLVIKSERKLHLVSAGQTLKSYRISLGKQPNGAKQREGDMRTPEGFTGSTGARPATSTTFRCTSPIPTHATWRARNRKVWPREA